IHTGGDRATVCGYRRATIRGNRLPEWRERSADPQRRARVRGMQTCIVGGNRRPHCHHRRNRGGIDARCAAATLLSWWIRAVGALERTMGGLLTPRRRYGTELLDSRQEDERLVLRTVEDIRRSNIIFSGTRSAIAELALHFARLPKAATLLDVG